MPRHHHELDAWKCFLGSSQNVFITSSLALSKAKREEGIISIWRNECISFNVFIIFLKIFAQTRQDVTMPGVPSSPHTSLPPFLPPSCLLLVHLFAPAFFLGCGPTEFVSVSNSFTQRWVPFPSLHSLCPLQPARAFPCCVFRSSLIFIYVRLANFWLTIVAFVLHLCISNSHCWHLFTYVMMCVCACVQQLVNEILLLICCFSMCSMRQLIAHSTRLASRYFHLLSG